MFAWMNNRKEKYTSWEWDDHTPSNHVQRPWSHLLVIVLAFLFFTFILPFLRIAEWCMLIRGKAKEHEG